MNFEQNLPSDKAKTSMDADRSVAADILFDIMPDFISSAIKKHIDNFKYKLKKDSSNDTELQLEPEHALALPDVNEKKSKSLVRVGAAMAGIALAGTLSTGHDVSGVLEIFW